ncbi:Isochorismatase hydrolase [Marasmius fiardii PR-910]|nr:Isochorismatase hydrolase [Marasmius fiardii PR-910]
MPTAGLPPDAITFVHNGTPTSSSPWISSPPCPLPKNSINASRHVLLLLDVQICNLSDPPTGVPAALELRKNILKVLTQARESYPPPLIIHVRNSGDVGEPDEHGSERWELMFPAEEGEWVVDKRKNNAFTGTKLGEWIRVDAEIVVVGVMSDYSIRATCSAALDRGNEVLLIRGAHGTYDRVEVLYGGGITPAQNIETEIEEELEEAGVHLMDMKDLPGIFTDR